MAEPSLLSLREAVRGEVLLPGDEGFDAAHKPWNLAVEQDVRAVVTAADADDVAALVRYAAEAGVPIAVQPTGHGASGSAAGAILLRTGRLDELTVDAGARTARIGAGVKSGAVTAAAAAHGLIHKPGSSPTVCVTYAGWPIAAAHDVSSISTTGAGHVGPHSRRASSGDISSMRSERPITLAIVDICSNWLSD